MFELEEFFDLYLPDYFLRKIAVQPITQDMLKLNSSESIFLILGSFIQNILEPSCHPKGLHGSAFLQKHFLIEPSESVPKLQTVAKEKGNIRLFFRQNLPFCYLLSIQLLLQLYYGYFWSQSVRIGCELQSMEAQLEKLKNRYLMLKIQIIYHDNNVPEVYDFIHLFLQMVMSLNYSESFIPFIHQFIRNCEFNHTFQSGFKHLIDTKVNQSKQIKIQHKTVGNNSSSTFPTKQKFKQVRKKFQFCCPKNEEILVTPTKEDESTQRDSTTSSLKYSQTVLNQTPKDHRSPLKRIKELQKLEKKIKKQPLERTLYLRQKNKFISRKNRQEVREQEMFLPSLVSESLLRSVKTEKKHEKMMEYPEEICGKILVGETPIQKKGKIEGYEVKFDSQGNFMTCKN